MRASMGALIGFLSKLRAFLNQRAPALIVRALGILAMSFAAAFGFLAAARNPASGYDPQAFATGAAALFGAACGGVALLVARVHCAPSCGRSSAAPRTSPTATGSSRRPRSAPAA
jgi:hypothetical protein